MKDRDKTAFVAGATGYVGREVVRLLTERGVRTIAHIRPGSSRLDEDRPTFESWGAEIDTTPWKEPAMAATLKRHAPDVVFCLIGTTRERMKAADDAEATSYEAVDYGLTALLVDACVGAGIEPRFVYISAIGVSPDSNGAYMKARWKAERHVVESGLPHTVARPAFISGPNRRESRPGERLAAVAGDLALGALSAVGLKKLRDKYESMTNIEIAGALVELALAKKGRNKIVEPDALRKLADEAATP